MKRDIERDIGLFDYHRPATSREGDMGAGGGVRATIEGRTGLLASTGIMQGEGGTAQHSTARDTTWDGNASVYTSVETLHCSGVWASLSREGRMEGGGGFPSGWVEHVYIHVHTHTCTCT